MGDPSVPGIRTFQMDASTVGVLKNSVNLFRGDVNYTQPLFSMPGRSANDGLQLDISIQYQSNVHNQAMTWNRDWPTGILGMGWSLPMPVITVENGGGPAPGLRRYTIDIGGVPAQLVRETVTAPLFDADPALAAQFADGQPVPAVLRGRFAKLGLPLSAGAIMAGNAGSWRIRDDGLEREYLLAAAPGALHVLDGGESYQLAGYKFWKVIYYTRYERWEVTGETGQVTSYGGGAARTDQYRYKTSAGNSIEWAVQWCDQNGHPSWIGNSALAAGQEQYARAWHIARAYSQFGDSVSYGYNELARAGGLLPGVEQLVGHQGRPYTKACYLTSITDVFGRKALFAYAPKLWGAAPASPREYADPHKEVPDNEPNGFQDRYETLYLDRIAVQDVDGQPLFSLQFAYDPSPGAAGAQAVANVAGGSGDTCKRLLTGFEIRNSAQASLPGFLFAYHLEAGQTSNPGALKSITWPTGGSATYAYRQAKLDICQRRAEVHPPPGMDGAKPRVWFGPDYAVVLWCDAPKGKLSLQILGWNGQWQPWQPDQTALLANVPQEGIDQESLTVLTGDNFVAVLFEESRNTNLHLFRKDPARPAQWIAASIPNDRSVGTGGCNSPTLTWQRSNGAVSALVGRNFLLVAQMHHASKTGSYDVLTWNWPSQSWTRSTTTTGKPMLFGGGTEYYAAVTLDGDNSSILLRHLAPTGEWKDSLPSVMPLDSDAPDDFALACGASFLALSHKIASTPTSQTYELSLLNWNDEYAMSAATRYEFADDFDEEHPTSWAPAVVSGALVAVAGNLMRFNGQKWLANRKLSPTAPQMDLEQRYAYGPDFAVLLNTSVDGRVVADGAQLLAYDANSSAAEWTDSAQAIVLPPDSDEIDCWASAGNGDYLTVGTGLFFRGTASNWSRPVSKPCIADLTQLVNKGASPPNRYKAKTQSVVNQGPQFLCLAADIAGQPNGSACFALPLRNGGMPGAPFVSQMLAGERMWTFQEEDVPGSGTWPGGDSAFFTYPARSTLDTADKVVLYRYAGDAIQGPVSHWPVSTVAIDDGLSERSINTYVPDPATAGCDASGNVVKYFKSTVHPGSDQDNRANGSVQNTYLNGNEIVDGTDFFNVLDGLLASSTISDRQGAVLMETRNEWTVYTRRAGDPCDGRAAPLQLYGAYVLKTGQKMVRDGVPSGQSTSYLPQGQHPLQYPYTGQPAISSTDIMNGGGLQEADVLCYTYACEVDQASRVLNRLTSPAGKTMSNDGVITSASATTLTGWPTLWGDDVLTPAEEASFGWTGGASVFPRASQPGQTPPNWQCVTRILQRDRHGNVIEHADGAGTRQSALMSEALGLPVATFNGAALAECAWNNFQDYENQSGWDIHGASLCTDNAWLGAQSLRLPPGSSLAAAVKPAAGRSAYLLGFRYQTQGGYNPAGSGWMAEPGGGQWAFADTQGQWRYVTARVALPPGTASLKLRAHNGGSGDVLLDSVLLVPFGTDVTTQSWRQAERLLRASMNTAGNASFTLYDDFWRPLGAVGGDGQLQELNARFLARQGSPGGRSVNDSPNAELTLNPANGGVAETFLDGGKWRSRWKPGNDSLWKAQGGVLSKADATPDILTWGGAGGAGPGVAFFVEISRPPVLHGPVAIRFGAGQTIAWTPGSGWSWTGTNSASLQAALAAPPAMASQWLLVLAANHLLFFGDGQLLFSQAAAVTAAQGFALSTGPNALRINNLGYGLDPRLGLSYLDGAARQRQVHQFRDGDSVVVEIVYDALDRMIAQTRAAPGSFGSGAHVPPLRYRDTFLDVPAFLAGLENTCAMRGDVAAYYTGQSDGGVARSNDQNYPYSGLRYGGAPLQRVTESGQPGLELSIHDVDTTTAAQRKTTRTAYAANGQGDGLPAGKYSAQTTTTPSGGQARVLADAARRAVLSMQMDGKGGNAAQTQVTPGYSDGGDGAAGTSGAMRLPNAYGGGPDAGAFVRTILQNPLGQPSGFADPDTGATTTLFNGKGKARFVRVALEPNEHHFLYARYDALGRMAEEGIVQRPWDAAALSAQADNLAYPAPSDGAVAARTYLYDGDGSDPNDIGKLTQTITFNPAPASDPALGACQVQERWSYDGLGRVRSATMELSGAASLHAGVTYHYNNLNEIVRIDLPADSPLANVVYAYNDQGQIASIGVAGTPDAIARYSWSADGQLAAATRGGLAETWAYDSPGRVLRHQVAVGGQPLFAQSFTYTPDGQMASRNTMGRASSAGQRTSQYSYDAQQRLAAAQAADGQPGSLTISRYDLNGNILAGVQDDKPFAATCFPGTNRLESANVAGSQEHGFRYRNDGRPDLWRGMKLEYDPALGTTSAAGNGSALVRYARGLDNHLVLRQAGGVLSIHFLGAGGVPLVIWTGGKPQVCVWGPGGLVAAQDGALRYPISDHQNTIWAVSDPQGDVVASYDYQPFGAITSENGSAAGSWPFQYSGKTWDGKTGLYDFGTRLYDPALRRFLQPDPARQYASAYVFVNNNPLNLIDPDGNQSLWAQVGLDIAMAVVTIAGVALAPETGGTSEFLSVEAIVAMSEEVEATEMEVSALQLRSAKSIPTRAETIVRSIGGGALKSAGISGMGYDTTHGRDFTWKAFGQAVSSGAMSGAVTGSLDPGAWGFTNSIKALGNGKGIAVRALLAGGTNVVGHVVSMALTDAIYKQNYTLHSYLIQSAGAFGTGALSGAFSGLRAITPANSAVEATDHWMVRTSNKINKLTATLKSSNAKTVYAITGAVVVSGYAIWGSVVDNK